MMRRLISWLSLSAFLLPAAAGLGKDFVFRPKACAPSRRLILSTARRTAASLQGATALRKKADPGPASAGDTLKVLGLMVQFRVDADMETTGDGRFIMEPSAGTTIDPPPHDASYFRNQLLALSNYYRSVSDGRLTILVDLLPAVLAVADSMGAYVPSGSDEDVTPGAARFFRDAVRQADAAGVRFSDYDCFIVFHAGVGGDLGFDYDPTPRDMPSMFLNLDDLKANLPSEEFNGQGLSVQNGAFGIPEGILLPETQSQEGYEIGLLGTAALMFGFQLGLPALWNTETGRSGIGAWGLMDQGSGNYNGLIPARPSAIERMLLGWTHPVPAWLGNRLTSACPGYGNSDQPGGGAVEMPFQVNIAGDEYYLIENRQHDPDGDGIARGMTANGGEVTFDADYQVHFSGEPSVIVSVDEYDYGLPGSGLLIWHVDESVLLAGLEDNRVNADPSRRGVDLEEADGSQDIGESYGMFDAGYGSENGVLQDAWYADNDVHLLVNGGDSIAFTSATHPNTRTNDGADSHVSLSGFSESGPVMTFSVQNDRMHEYYPRIFRKDVEPFAPIVGNFDGIDYRDIMLVTRDGGVHLWDVKTDIWPLDKRMAARQDPDLGSGNGTMETFLGDAGGTVSIPPVSGDQDGDGMDELVLLTDNGHVEMWKIVGSLNPALPEVRISAVRTDRSLDGEKGTALVLVQSNSPGLRAFIGTESGRILSLDAAGTLLPIADLFSRPVTGIACWGSADTLMAVASNGEFAIFNAEGDLLLAGSAEDSARSGPVTGTLDHGSTVRGGFFAGGRFLMTDAAGRESEWDRRDEPGAFESAAIADVNGDGAFDIVSVSGGQVWCMNRNGSLIEGFPARVAEAGAECSDPVIGDIDGDGRMEILVSTSDGIIAAVSADGGGVEGFPLPLYGKKAVSPSLADADGDGRIEILAASDGGWLAMWDMDGSAGPQALPWPMARHDAAGTGRSDLIPGPADSTASGTLLPGRYTYNYPNPAYGDFTVIRYRLQKKARVRIRIYSLAGAEVAAFDGPGEGPADNEVLWKLSGVDSGVYFCRIQAMASGESRSAMIKIAVVK
jgi:M6 family metalloprotease-like protein